MKQEDITKVKLKEPKITYHKGQKNPPMTKEFSLYTPLPLKGLCEQVILYERAKNEDFRFIKSILQDKKTADFNGYNMKNIRSRGESPKPKTDVAFLPLLDPLPIHPWSSLLC